MTKVDTMEQNDYISYLNTTSYLNTINKMIIYFSHELFLDFLLVINVRSAVQGTIHYAIIIDSPLI